MPGPGKTTLTVFQCNLSDTRPGKAALTVCQSCVLGRIPGQGKTSLTVCQTSVIGGMPGPGNMA